MRKGEFYDRLIYLRDNVGNYPFEYRHTLQNLFLIEIEDDKPTNDLNDLITTIEFIGNSFLSSEQMYLMVETFKWDLITDVDLSDDGYYYLVTV